MCRNFCNDESSMSEIVRKAGDQRYFSPHTPLWNGDCGEMVRAGKRERTRGDRSREIERETNNDCAIAEDTRTEVLAEPRCELSSLCVHRRRRGRKRKI